MYDKVQTYTGTMEPHTPNIVLATEFKDQPVII